MRAVLLRKPGDLAIAEVADPGRAPAGHVRVRVGAVGICGSDVHYYEAGRIGDFVVRSPMVLGHETAGTVDEVGPGVQALKAGDRVAMEPGVPCGSCGVCRAGRYNLCPDIRFWATPPVDGSLAEYVVHPAAFTFRLPATMSMAEGALIEPLAVGVHACRRGRVGPGDVVAITGAGTIGAVTLMAALAFGASRVVVSDVVPERLERARRLGASDAVDARTASIGSAVRAMAGRGADVAIECSGHTAAPAALIDAAAPGGRLVLVGMGPQPVPIDTVAAMVKELDVATVFRYAHAYQTAIDLVATGRIRPEVLVTDRFPFARSVEAFELARRPAPGTGKVLIELQGSVASLQV
jgi:2-desacetyl-2-hydroxyethyl bacteriochlorophyllide A dehydrogenase